MKKMLILVPNLNLGGQQRVAVNSAEILASDYEISIVVFDASKRVYFPECEVIDLSIPAHSKRIQKIVNVLRRVHILRKIRKSRDIFCCLSLGPSANLVNILSRGCGMSVCSWRGYQSVVKDTYLMNFINRHSDVIIGCSKVICSTISNNNMCLARKIRCIYNPIDIERIEEKGKASVEDYSFSAHTVISHGRLDKVKNWPRLIKAFYIVKQQIADAQLLIIGEGDMRKKLEKLIEYYGLQNSVTLPGFRENPFSYLARGSLYVMTSYSEGFPNALLEGMTFMPVVSVDCRSGPREILSSTAIDTTTVGWEEVDYGILVQPADSQDYHQEIDENDLVLADAILAIMEDKLKSERMKAAAHQRVQDFSNEKYRERLISILENA